MAYNYKFHLFPLQLFISDILNFPPVERCKQLNILIDRCSVKELQDLFPMLIQSVFSNGPGGNQLGWGLRTLTRKSNVDEYNGLYSFFHPGTGSMLRLCYRLLNEPIKFDLPIEMLPVRRT